ncbi:FAD-binding oxidoreductase [Telmatospirillum sp. J64-1]|uniref:NAD(P)/FAD-dependent oxidoreductase n=1 Tax=Telmatospirillum sp. J64-1 TaxID=2502183 RepID=UPI00115EB8B4|nr:FAD-dependent oxidoreductase [Telmatospirillum sp. J64-1]
MPQQTTRDVVIVGGGLIGAAVGFGLQRRGLSTVILDEGDVAFRAARGNFGLVWIQSKGSGSPDYVAWTRRAVDAWPDFAAELADLTGIDVGYRRPGGFHLCLSQAEVEQRGQMAQRVSRHQREDGKTVMVDAAAVRERVAGLGEAVVGASYNPLDGDCSSLALFRALHEGYARLGGTYRPATAARSIRTAGGAYRIETDAGAFAAPKVVFASGLGLNHFAAQVGLPPLVRAQKGQIIVTERMRPFLDLPISQIRQTPDGTVLIGDTKEEVGFDTASTMGGMIELAQRAVRALPRLADTRIIRSWGALRVLTADGLPLYEEAAGWPGVFFLTSHSGVTLAPAHAIAIAQWVAAGEMPDELQAFSATRVQAEKVA